jgi:recombinase
MVLETIDDRYSGVGALSTKVMCGKCGAYFSARPWHSTSYNNLVWQCRKRYAKEKECKNTNVYDYLLVYLLHNTARKQLVDRDIIDTFKLIIAKAIPEKSNQIAAFIKMFLTADIWTTASDLADLALIIKAIVINEDRSMDILWLGGQRAHC